ncbi:MAG: FkbM family methyltransferase [Bacteroidetes bacterium]|nr:FkbM family methyltransferase [Bacteroidota bacterium]
MLQPLKSLALKFVSPKTILKFLKRKHLRTGDPELKFIKYLIPSGTDAVDVGVYRGVYTSVMADSAGKVYAFEPHPHNYAFSKKALPKEKVKLFTEALSNKNGEAELQIPVEYESAGSISKSFEGRKVHSFKVITKKMDEFNLKNIGFMKIDAEGHEYEIIDGARNTIAENKPNLIVEIEQRHISRPIQEVFDEIIAMGYKGFYYFNGSVHPLSSFTWQKLQPNEFIGVHTNYVNNFMFIHNSRTIPFKVEEV